MMRACICRVATGIGGAVRLSAATDTIAFLFFNKS